MSEWRTLPEFPDYEITSDGCVRNKWSHRKLNETQNKNTGAWSYSLRRRDKSSTQRAFWGLIYSAWPELKPAVEPKPPVRNYSRRGQWVDMPGFPTYQAHPDGLVRYKASRRLREIHYQGGEKYVKLFDDHGKRRRRMIDEIMTELFLIVDEAA